MPLCVPLIRRNKKRAVRFFVRPFSFFTLPLPSAFHLFSSRPALPPRSSFFFCSLPDQLVYRHLEHIREAAEQVERSGFLAVLNLR